MKSTINQTAALTSPKTSKTSKNPSTVTSSSCLASLEKQASVGGKLASVVGGKLASVGGGDKKVGRQSNRILKSGSGLFVTSKKNAAFSQYKKTTPKFPAPNSPTQSTTSSNVKLVVFPKMNKVFVFNSKKDAELATRVKLDMKSALKDRTNVQSCFSAQSYEPNDQSEEGMSLRGDNKPNLFGDDLLAATAAASVFRRRQTSFLSARTKNICIIVSIALLLLIGLVTLLVMISILLSSAAAAVVDVQSSTNLTDTTGNFSPIESTPMTTAGSSAAKSLTRKLKPSKKKYTVI